MIINTDGGARGNPGPGACGVVIRSRDGVVIKKLGKYLGKCTNNEAEYHGLILGLEEALKMGADELEVLLDSQLITNQMLGKYKVKDGKLKLLYQKATSLVKKFSNVSFVHISREKNKMADYIVNKIIDNKIKNKSQ